MKTIYFKKIAIVVTLLLIVIGSIFVFNLNRETLPAPEKHITEIHTPIDSTTIPPVTIQLPPKTITPPGTKPVLLPVDSLLKGMTLTFQDEFNTFSRYTDAKGNTTCNPGGTGVWQTVYHFCSRTIPTNHEAEIYIDQSFLDYLNSRATVPTTAESPYTISDGILAIKAAPSDDAIKKAAGAWAKYTSGVITTQFSFSQIYGYFEIRAKLPAGEGLWPAFWLLPVDKTWPPEIDVLEAFGGKNEKNEGGPTYIHYASHTKDKSKSCSVWHNIGVDITKDFHTYGADWEPTGITFYFDGKPYGTCPPNIEANKPFYMLVDLAVGGEGSWPGTPDSTNIWPAYIYIDYVRAYQKI